MINDTDDYDNVIVGAGSAGTVVATRLSEDPHRRVLLIEAGGEAAGIEAIRNPRLWFTNIKSEVDWGYDTELQPGTWRIHPWARGKVVGGSSAINATAFMRADAALYDAWARAGNPGWDFNSLLPYFKRSERVDSADRPFRGDAGPLRPAPAVHPNPTSLAFVDACLETGHCRVGDFNGGSIEGAGLHDLNVVAGARQSVADAYLTGSVRARPNLAIQTRTRALKLLLERPPVHPLDSAAGSVGTPTAPGC